MSLPFRRRLTLWNVALLAVILLLFGSGIYVGLRTVLFGQFEEQARTQAILLSSAVEVEGDQLAWDEEEIAAFQDDDNFVRLISASGEVILDSSAVVNAAPFEPQDFSRAMQGATTFATDSIATETMGVVSVPVRDEDKIVGVFQVAISRSDADEVLSSLLLVMAVGLPLTLLTGAIGSWVVAGRAIAPVSAITDLAERINASDLSARLNLDLPDDELGRLASTFDTMLSRIESAFERQRQFTADAAHELRTPLAVMHARAEENLLTMPDSATTREAWQQTVGDLERMQQIVAALLTLARSDANALSLDIERFDLTETAVLVAEQMGSDAIAAGVSVQVSDQPVLIEADQDLLVQLLVNLVDNAIRNSNPGGAVQIEIGQTDDQVTITVMDSGVGIAAEHLPYLFDRFYRVETTRSDARHGIGLGLAICRAIVTAHGGSIDVQSHLGVGTSFTVTLPASSQLHHDIPD